MLRVQQLLRARQIICRSIARLVIASGLACAAALTSLALLSSPASAQALAKQTEADYQTVRGWGTSVAQILNAGKCISLEDFDRIEAGYQRALSAFGDDVRRLTGVAVPTSKFLPPSVLRSDSVNYSGWSLKVFNELNFFLDSISDLKKRICGTGNFTFGDNSIKIIFLKTSSSTTVTSPTDQQKRNIDPPQLMLSGDANFGSWFVMGQVTFAGAPHGSFTDTFPATPAFNTTATINSGTMTSFEADAGYTLFQTAGFSLGVFGGYYEYDESVYGMFPGFAGQFAIANDVWRAGEGGVKLDSKFAVGNVPFDLAITATGLADHLYSGAFSGHGGGARATGVLSFPLGPLSGNIYGQYTDLNASGTAGVTPLQFRNQNWAVGAGVSYAFGGPPAASPASMVFKAPTK